MYISEENPLSITQESLVYEVLKMLFLFFELGKTSILLNRDLPEVNFSKSILSYAG